MTTHIPGRIGHCNRIHDLLQQRRSLNVEEVVNAMTGISAKQASSALTNLMDTGRAHRARTGYHETRYFFDPKERDAYLAAQGGEYQPPALRPRHTAISRATLAASTPVIVPPHVKVQVCPSWTHDPRVQIDPAITRLPPNLKGAGFVADWNKKRRSRVTARSQA